MTTDKINKCRESGKKLNRCKECDGEKVGYLGDELGTQVCCDSCNGSGQQPIETVILDIVELLIEARGDYNIIIEQPEYKDVQMPCVSSQLAEAFVRLCGMEMACYPHNTDVIGKNIDHSIRLILNCICSPYSANYDLCTGLIIAFCKHNNIDLEKYCDKLCEEVQK